ncbi:MAG: thiolase family protein [Thermotogae bacterium]|nr:thiolase family protein [Thermotogota bacterium]
MKKVVVAYPVRTPIGKAPRGTLKDTRPDELAALVISEVVRRSGIDPKEIDDVIMGCAFPEAEQGMNVARIALLRAGLPVDVPGMTINRFCSSGLQSIAIAAQWIMAGWADMIIAGGVESMSKVPMGGLKTSPNPNLMDNMPEAYMSMGLTAERVAEMYNISREEQDKFGYESHMKAARAIKEGRFKEQIIPVKTRVVRKDEDGNPYIEEVVLEHDEGVRFDTSLEKMAKLKPVFKQNGTVTAGNASQTSDGASAVLVMSEEKAKALGIKGPAAYLRSYAVAGVPPEIMGIGPVKAVPKALKLAGLSVDDLDVIELNEAFAAQSLAVIKELNLPYEKVNPNGGAIAHGHPLGATGAILTTKLLYELRRIGGKLGMVTMCIGGGMGAAGVFEMAEF